ncbi:MAG: flavodoxin family protein [Desulfovibrionaceae bacterium]|nr:flavodoxin family protein [Desulfovibrionaceae bacterium]
MPKVLLFEGSPHRGGTTEVLSDRLENILNGCGVTLKRISISDVALRPCMGCGFCSSHPDQCVLDGCTAFDACGHPGTDRAAEVLREMIRADALILTIPVYFYGPPAPVKALFDRIQRYWAQSLPAEKPFFAVYYGARKKGAHLFDGNALIARCALRVLGFTQKALLTLYGVETFRDLQHAETMRSLDHFARMAADFLKEREAKPPDCSPCCQ